MSTKQHLNEIILRVQELIFNHADFIEENEKRALLGNLEDLNFFHVESIGDQLSIGVFICDTEGTVLYLNKENERLVGLSYEQAVGKNYRTLLSANKIGNVIITHCLETKEPFSSLAFSPITGTQFLETGSPVFDLEGNLIGVVVIDQDITETMTLTENLRASESKVAHYREIVNQNAHVINQLNRQGTFPSKNFTDYTELKSQAVQEAYQLARQAAQTDVTVLITGESGCGKEVFSNMIFENSERNKQPYIKVNCAAIPATLLESEMFGYVKGAFTGANPKGKAGMFELANNGTLFLDEIGELPLEFQAKLLRAIQNKEITRVGDLKPMKLNVRIIAATNRNLKQMVAEGKFREDLYYRIFVFPITIPPLRERREDIPVLTEHFLKIFNRKYGKNIIMQPDAMSGLCAYSWPGNIRELENLIERWTVIYQPYTSISWNMIRSYFSDLPEDFEGSPYQGHSLKELISDYERKILTWAFTQYGTTRGVAKALGVDHSTIVRKAKALNLGKNGSAREGAGTRHP